MNLSPRLSQLLDNIVPCELLADVGCDHGFLAKAALDRGLCRGVVISDISEPSLNKARKLLENYPNVVSAVCDGLAAAGNCDQAVIAGIGGDEISGILERADKLPERLVLAPQKNAIKVRIRLLALGYGIERDYMFGDKKFYSVITASKSCNTKRLDGEQLEYGKDNIGEMPTAFTDFLSIEIGKFEERIKKTAPQSKAATDMRNKVAEMRNILNRNKG